MDKPKSTVTSKFDGAQQISTHSKGTTARPERINIQCVQNVYLIWLDSNIDENSDDCRNILTHLRQAVNDIKIFTDVDSCIDFLTDISHQKVCMLISDSLCQSIMPLIHDITQLHTIVTFCTSQTTQEQWVQKWSKIKGAFSEIVPICGILKEVAQQCEQDAISISFVATDGDISKISLDKLDPIFMYSQILKEILLTITFDEEHIKQYADYCRKVFSENDKQLINVNRLQTEYHTKTPIWWYTYASFLYPMLNSALRLMDMDIIIKMGFFIDDLHRHIDQLHSEQFTGNNSNQIFTVYRGQSMSRTDFDKMKNIQGGLMSFNNFLSTSKNLQVSLIFAEPDLGNTDIIGILFFITVDPAKSTAPFASVVNVGHFGDQEEEVLFSMHTVFRIGEITPIDGNLRLFQVQLTLTSDNDKDLRVLIDRIREDTFPDDNGWYRMGLLLLQLGESAKAQQIYEMLLKQTTNIRQKSSIFLQLGQVKDREGEFNEAITFYEKALKIFQRILSPTDSDLASCYNNIGGAYSNMGDYPKALSYYEKALESYKQSLPSNHLDLNNSYNNIGLVYSNMGDYPKALLYHERALEIYKQSLPSNHPHLGGSYNNIGLVYSNMGNYPKALMYYKKALEINKQSLPSNHSGFVMCYSNIAGVYSNMGDYSNAVSYYEKALEIQKQSLPSNHPSLAAFYINIDLMYSNIDDYPKALSYYEKALEIQKQSLPSNHPQLGMFYNNIGVVCANMGNYSKALSSHEKALEIRKQSLSSNHPDMVASYNNIGLVYDNMGDYPKALSYYERALENIKQSLPSNHPNLVTPYNNIGGVYANMGDYPKAISSYEKALEIGKQSLPSNHPHLSSSYYNIGVVYDGMGDYAKARSFYERAVEIGEYSLPRNHPHLELYKKNLNSVKK